MLLIYTGHGKGKTSACLGQALRALGQGMKVAFAQFMKRPGKAGEQLMLEKLLNSDFLAGGLGFFRNEEDRDAHTRAAQNVLAFARARLEEVDMLILDEALYALSSGLINQEDLRILISSCENKNTHLVLSGRGSPDWLVEIADTVTEMKEIKHHFTAPTPQTPGIDY